MYLLKYLFLLLLVSPLSILGMKRAQDQLIDSAADYYKVKDPLYQLPQELLNGVGKEIVTSGQIVKFEKRIFENNFVLQTNKPDWLSLGSWRAVSKKSKKVVDEIAAHISKECENVILYKDYLKTFSCNIPYEVPIAKLNASLDHMVHWCGVPRSTDNPGKRIQELHKKYWKTLHSYNTALQNNNTLDVSPFEQALNSIEKDPAFVQGYYGSDNEAWIMDAYIKNDINRLKLYYSRGINMRNVDALQSITEYGNENEPGMQDIFKILIADSRARECIITKYGSTPLLVAAAGKPVLVKIVLEAGANVNARNDDGESAVDVAFSAASLNSINTTLQTLKLLLNHPDNKEWNTLSPDEWNNKLLGYISKHVSQKMNTVDALYNALKK